MSIDTVRCSIDNIQLPDEGIFDRELVSYDVRNKTEFRKYVTLGLSDDLKAKPRITYFPIGSREVDQETGQVSMCTNGRLIFEVSLPKFALGENMTVLDDEQVEKTVDDLGAWVSDKVKFKLPEPDKWRVSRLDSVWCWAVGPSIEYYFQALKECPVAGYVRVPYIEGNNSTQGFTWRAHYKKVNAYDKGREANKDQEKGLLRLEVQNLNRKAVKSLSIRSGIDSDARSLISADVAKRDIQTWLDRIGMGQAVRANFDLYRELYDKFGLEGAASRYFFIEGYRRYGAGLSKMISDRTYKRRYSEAKKSGWFLQADKELPGLRCMELED